MTSRLGGLTWFTKAEATTEAASSFLLALSLTSLHLICIYLISQLISFQYTSSPFFSPQLTSLHLISIHLISNLTSFHVSSHVAPFLLTSFTPITSPHFISLHLYSSHFFSPHILFSSPLKSSHPISTHLIPQPTSFYFNSIQLICQLNWLSFIPSLLTSPYFASVHFTSLHFFSPQPHFSSLHLIPSLPDSPLFSPHLTSLHF